MDRNETLLTHYKNIYIEGNIASGKSSLIDYLKDNPVLTYTQNL